MICYWVIRIRQTSDLFIVLVAIHAAAHIDLTFGIVDILLMKETKT